MWINNREWIVFSACIMLIVPGILYFLCKPYYHQYHINNLMESKKILIMSDKKENKNLIVKVDGVSSSDYVLQLSMSDRNVADSSYIRTYYEEIKIPAGHINGNFERDFPGDKSTRKAEIIYRPANKSAKGTINLEAGIF